MGGRDTAHGIQDGHWQVSSLLACVCAKSLQSRLTVCYHMDCSLPDSSVHGFSNSRIHELELMSLMSPVLAGRFFTTSDTQEAHPTLLTFFKSSSIAFQIKGKSLVWREGGLLVTKPSFFQIWLLDALVFSQSLWSTPGPLHMLFPSPFVKSSLFSIFLCFRAPVSEWN